MIRNTDGTPYKLKGEYKQFDPASPDQNLFNSYDEEVIRIGGSPIYYYEVLIQFQTLDRLYKEDRGKLFSNVPIMLYGYYEPPQQANISGLYGVDTPDEETLITMNYQAVLREIGHPPKVGSRLFTPHRGEEWIIIDRRLEEFKAWSALHIALICRKFVESRTSSDADYPQDQPNVKIIN